MCSIAGVFSKNKKDIEHINVSLKHRGPDNSKIANFQGLQLAHNLLSIVGFVPQPLQSKNCILIANCEIYNWESLCKSECISAKNDSELLFLLLQKYKTNISKAINLLNGDYAFAFFFKDKNKIKGYISRDIFGIKPLWYYLDKNNFYFSSERKSFPIAIRSKAIDLNPRILLNVNINTKTKKIILKEEYL